MITLDELKEFRRTQDIKYRASRGAHALACDAKDAAQEKMQTDVNLLDSIDESIEHYEAFAAFQAVIEAKP